MKIESLTGRGIFPFFSVTVPPPDAKSKSAKPSVKLFDDSDLQAKVSSFQIEESEAAPAVITLTVLDDTGRINKKYTYGFNVEVEFGLKQSRQSFLPSFLTRSDPNAIKGDYKRRIKGHFLNYSPAGADGIVLSSITLRAAEIGGYNQVRKVHAKGRPKDVIDAAIKKMGLNSVIGFSGMDEPLSNKNFIVQGYESYWSFLRKLSFKYECKLVIQGDTVFFISWKNQHDAKYAEIRGATGIFHKLDYGTMDGGIISFSFDAQSNSTNGSTISIVTGPDGTSSASFSPSPAENVEIWELDPGKIKKALGAQPTISQKMKLLAEVESAGVQDLDRFKELYFRKRTTTTAPEGYGFTGKLKILPNPNIIVGDYMFLGSEKSLIPPQFKSREKGSAGFVASLLNPKPPEVDKATLWRVTKSKSVIDASNYTMELEVAR